MAQGYTSTQEKRSKEIHLGQAINIVMQNNDTEVLSSTRDSIKKQIKEMYELIEETHDEIFNPSKLPPLD